MATKGSLRAVKAPAPIFQLRIDLLHLKPAIWRRIVVPGTIKLSLLHVVILQTMGWMGGHMHEFIIGERNFGNADPDSWGPPVEREDRVTLARALGGLKSFIYIYDFGDCWEHRVKVEKILPPSVDLSFPMCLAGANACPPEDVGGSPGYVDFLEAIRDPSHEEHHHLLEWCGGNFDPTAFHLDDINRTLSDILF